MENRAGGVTVRTSERYTPPDWADFARQVFGRGIALDPASSATANQVIKADRYYTKIDDGLAQSWRADTIWVNPPYDRKTVTAFTEKLRDELPNIGQCLLLVNNCSETQWFQKIAKTADRILFPCNRIQFWKPGEDPHNFTGRNEYKQALLYWGYANRFAVFDKLASPRGLVVEVIADREYARCPF